MSKDGIYENIRSEKKLVDRGRLLEIIAKVKSANRISEDIDVEDLISWRNHTIELSYLLRERAIEKLPNGELGQPDFEEEYTRQFRGLDLIELESMILSHEHEIHRRRENTIRIIRDAYMNKLIMEEK